MFFQAACCLLPVLVFATLIKGSIFIGVAQFYILDVCVPILVLFFYGRKEKNPCCLSRPSNCACMYLPRRSRHRRVCFSRSATRPCVSARDRRRQFFAAVGLQVVWWIVLIYSWGYFLGYSCPLSSAVPPRVRRCCRAVMRHNLDFFVF